MFSLSRTSCWHVNWRIIKSHLENIMQNLQLLNKNNPYYTALHAPCGNQPRLTGLAWINKVFLSFFSIYLPSFYVVIKVQLISWNNIKHENLNRISPILYFLSSKSQRHIAIKCQHSPSSSSRDKFAINISNPSHDSDKTLSMYSKGPLSSKHILDFFHIRRFFRFSSPFASFRAFLQVFESRFDTTSYPGSFFGKDPGCGWSRASSKM
jgi:hypothetical protein